MIGRLRNSMCFSQKISVERTTLESWCARLLGLMFTAFLGLAQATGRARAQGSQSMRWQEKNSVLGHTGKARYFLHSLRENSSGLASHQLELISEYHLRNHLGALGNIIT